LEISIKRAAASPDHSFGTQPGALVANFAFQPDGCGKQERSAYLEELLDALPICTWD
jgi:hypothetical protein